jgi:hypothetical protein
MELLSIFTLSSRAAFRSRKLTSINNFSKETFAPQKIFCGTIPTSVPKLELAFLNGLVGTLGYCY